MRLVRLDCGGLWALGEVLAATESTETSALTTGIDATAVKSILIKVHTLTSINWSASVGQRVRE